MIKYGKPITMSKEKIDALIKYFQNDKEIVAIYLFGSYASGNEDLLSDIDIAFLLCKRCPVTFDKELGFLNKINSLLGTDEVSFVILNKAPLTFKHKIISESKLLYCANEIERLDFEQQVEDLYFDFSPMLSLYDNELIMQVKDGSAFD